jgi:hypothetical protein
MPDREAIGIWRSRLRWRLRGAWQWPTFAVVTAADALLLARLPFTENGMGLVPAFLLAGFLNLAVIAVIGPVAGALLRRRRPGLPREVARDMAGAVGLLLTSAALLVGGLAHRNEVEAANAEFAVAVDTARAFLAHQAPAAYRLSEGRSNTWQPGPHLYRTCFPGPDPRRDFCVLVQTGEGVPIVRRDPDQRPNAEVAGPDNPGRAAP